MPRILIVAPSEQERIMELMDKVVEFDPNSVVILTVDLNLEQCGQMLASMDHLAEKTEGP